MNIFRTFWKALRELFEDMFILTLCNIVWLLINLPFALVLFVVWNTGPLLAALAVLVLSVLSIGPANAGLYTIAERVTEGRTSSWRNFFEGMREHALLSWKLYGLWLLGLALIIFNLQFYNLSSSQIASFISVVFVYLLIVWCGLLIYIGPLMIIQSDKRIRAIARNAALMTFGRPLFTLGTLLLMAIILVSSIWLTFLLFVGAVAFLALWGFRATLTLIAEAEAKRAQLAEQAGEGVAPKGRGGQVRPRE